LSIYDVKELCRGNKAKDR